MRKIKILLILVFLPNLLFAQLNNDRINYDKVELKSELLFKNIGVEGKYFIFYDGEVLDSISKISVLPIMQKIKIYQIRFFGEFLLWEGEILPIIDKKLSVEFSIPHLTDFETTYFLEKEKFIQKYFDNTSMFEVLKEELQQLIQLFSVTNFNPTLEDDSIKYQALLDDLMKKHALKEKKIEQETEPEIKNELQIDGVQIFIQEENIKEIIEQYTKSDFFIHLGVSFSNYWYPISDTFATKVGGGFDFGFSASVKNDFGIGYFIDTTFEPGIIFLGLGLSPSFHFYFKEKPELGISLFPLDLALRMNYDDLDPQFGFMTGVGIDYSSFYFRFSVGGGLDKTMLCRLVAGLRLKLTE